ncbi:MAG: hypothetical protein HYS13_08255 [Planctomycetia bacterium]|nr:hypothetical protein [Planctomycetia bacterium]
MNRLRFSLAALMAFILLAALGFAALRSASRVAAWATLAVACGALLAAAVAAIRWRGKRRAAFLCFAFCGGAYLAVALSNVIPWLPTTLALEHLNTHLESPPNLSQPDSGARVSHFWLRAGFRCPFGTIPAARSIESTSDPTVVQATLDPSDSTLWVVGAEKGGVADVVVTVQGGARQVLRIAVGPDQRDRRAEIGHALVAMLVALLAAVIVFAMSRKNPGARTVSGGDAARQNGPR